jgi:hypothetical protein
MDQTYYLALAVLASAATYLWAYRSRRIALTTAVASATWALLALTGADVTTVTDSGSTVAVPLPDAARYLLAALALLSLLAFILYVLGSYPPEETDVPDAGEGATARGAFTDG